MCTMTWVFQDGGYELFFNRDEVKTRLIAFPPVIQEKNGVSVVAPIDADAGGTWMGVNDLGISVCLLNGFGVVDGTRSDFISRGKLVLDMLDIADANVAGERVCKMDLTRFRPFSLCVIAPGHIVKMWNWDGKVFSSKADVKPPLISSSFRLDSVAENRGALFECLGRVDGKTLEAYHRSHEPEAGPFSVCMHREDAQTVSVSRVVVTARQVAFHYAPGSPCQTDFQPPVCLPRRVDAVA